MNNEFHLQSWLSLMKRFSYSLVGSIAKNLLDVLLLLISQG
nr:MAG TPA: hypothetical protein [Caudoviricetes sp.]